MLQPVRESRIMYVPASECIPLPVESFLEFKQKFEYFFGEAPFILSKQELPILETIKQMGFELAAVLDLIKGIENYSAIDVHLIDIVYDETKKDLEDFVPFQAYYIPLSKEIPLSFSEYERFVDILKDSFGESPIRLTSKATKVLRAYLNMNFEMCAISDLISGINIHDDIIIHIYNHLTQSSPILELGTSEESN